MLRQTGEGGLTTMFLFSRRNDPSTQENGETWSELRASLRHQFPNPQRHGCPDSALLKKIAAGGVELQQVRFYLDHFSQCSPCFNEFEHLQQEAARQTRFRKAVSAVAMLIACAWLGVWMWHSNSVRKRADDLPLNTEATGERAIHTVSLYLEPPLATRAEDSVVKAPPSLPREAFLLSVYLPYDSKPGEYEFELLAHMSDASPIVRFRGRTKSEKQPLFLQTKLNLSRVQSGTYLLRYRRSGGGWLYSYLTIS